MDRTLVTSLILDASSYKKGIDTAKQVTANLNKEMELWKTQNNATNNSLKTLVQQAKVNADKQKILSTEIELTKKKLQEVTDANGAASKEAMTYKNKLTDLQIQQAKLNNEIGGGLTPLKNFQNGMETAGKKLSEVGNKISSFGKGMSTYVTGPILAAGAGILKLATSAGESADELITLSNKTGITTQALQQMQYAARFIDVSIETMTGSMQKLTKNMDMARRGTKEQEEAFARLGIEFKNQDGSLKNAKTVWMEAIDALGNISSEADRDALSMNLFGKSAADLNPLIKAGSAELARYYKEADAVGAVLSDETVRALGKFDDSMQQIKAVTQAAGSEIAAAFLPIIQDSLIPFIQTSLIPAFKTFAESVKKVIEWFQTLSPEIKSIIAGIALLTVTIGPALVVVGQIAVGVGALTALLASSTVALIASKIAMVAHTVASGAATAAQWLLNAALTANPLAIVVVAVTALVGALIALWNTNEGFRNALISAWEAIKKVAIAVFDGVKSAVETVIGAISGVINTVQNALRSIGILNDTKIADKSYTVTENRVTVYSSVEGTGGGMSGGTSGGKGGVGGGGGFANGTTNASPGFHLVGEEGPELLRFRGGEQVVPNSKLGSNVFNINITGNTIANDYDVNRIGEQLVSYLKSKGVRLATPY